MCYPIAGAECTSDKNRRVKMYLMSRLLKQNIKYNKNILQYNTIQSYALRLKKASLSFLNKLVINLLILIDSTKQYPKEI